MVNRWIPIFPNKPPKYTFLRILVEGKGKVEKNQYADYLEKHGKKVLLSTEPVSDIGSTRR